jgi:hypothetical protein
MEEKVKSRLLYWSHHLGVALKEVVDVEGIADESLRNRARKGHLKSFLDKDGGVLYVLPANFKHSDESEVDNLVVTGVVARMGLSSFVNDVSLFGKMASDIWSSPFVPDELRDIVRMTLSGDSYSQVSSVRAGVSLLSLMG